MKIERIELENSMQGNNKSGKVKKPKMRKFSVRMPGLKIWLSLLAFLIVIFAFIVFFIGLPSYNIYKQGLVVRGQAKRTYEAIKNQDIPGAKKELAAMKKDLKELDARISKINWLGSIAVVGEYQKDLKRVTAAGIAGVQAGEITIVAIEPYTDLLGLEGGSKFVNKSTEERLQTALTTLDKITPKLGDIAKKLEIVQKEINAIDPNRYPENFRGTAVRSQLVNAQDQLGKTAGLFIEARPFLEAFPDLVGANEPKTYLILFQNDKELRPTGGFITAYAYFRLDQGKIQVIKSDDIYNLDNSRSKKVSAPDEILKYHKNVYTYNLRDSNLSPDFKTSMLEFEKLYESVGSAIQIDGIVTVDTHVLVEAMKILGPIPAYGTTFTTEPDDRCGGCPQVVYELEEYADKRVGYIRENRKDIIGVLLLQIMQKSLGVSPGEYWGPLFQMFLDEIQQKHILAYLHDEDAQKGVEALNFGGKIEEYKGDYLHINDANFAGAKANLFTTHKIVQNINIADDGTVTKEIEIVYENTAAGSPGCNLERGGVCLNGLLRNWVRVYVPEGAKLLEFKGSKKGFDPVTKKELGKTVFEGFTEVKPKGQAKIKLSYELPFKVTGGKYNILIQKQPGTEGHEYIINLNGKEVEKFNLTTDKEFNFKL